MNAEVLLVGPESLAAPLRQRADGRLLHFAQPYEALETLSRRPVRSVVLGAPQPELDGLCKAARTLAPQAAIMGLCWPAGESQLRGLGPLLDDYFIFPPTPAQLDRLLAAGSPRSRPARAAASARQLDPADVAVLIEHTQNLAGLEQAISSLVAGLAGCEVKWQDAAQQRGQMELMRIEGERPRVLVPSRGQQPPVAGLEALRELKVLLPSLVASARRTEGLHRLAVTDHLTGSYNRRYFMHLTDQILQQAAGQGLRVSLLLLDIDNFKRYNDTYGYAAGDEILRETTQLLRKVTRKQDIIARIGGDEFTVLFWDPAQPRKPGSQPPQTAYVLADRFRRAITRHQFPSLGSEARGVLTVSGGIASYPEAATARELLVRADQTLKAAKRTGKNLILVGPEPANG